MKTVADSRREIFGFDYCKHVPHGYVVCEHYGICNACELGARLRKEQARVMDYPLLSWRDARPQTASQKGETWYQKPVILSPEAMRRLGLEMKLINQVMIAYDGPGVFKKNVVGEIDGYLLNDRTKRFTVTRSECYGIPTARAAEYFDECYFLGLSQLLKI